MGWTGKLGHGAMDLFMSHIHIGLGPEWMTQKKLRVARVLTYITFIVDCCTPSYKKQASDDFIQLSIKFISH
jgi:hypothetical protein